MGLYNYRRKNNTCEIISVKLFYPSVSSLGKINSSLNSINY